MKTVTIRGREFGVPPFEIGDRVMATHNGKAALATVVGVNIVAGDRYRRLCVWFDTGPWLGAWHCGVEDVAPLSVIDQLAELAPG